MASVAVVKKAGEGSWLEVLGMRIKFLATSEDAGSRHSSILNTVPPGTGAPPHRHPWDESFYVLQGVVEFRVGEALHRLSEGDFVMIPAGHVHGFRGLSEEEGLLLGYEVPSHSQAFFQEISDRVRSLPDDLELMPAIGQRHEVEFC